MMDASRPWLARPEWREGVIRWRGADRAPWILVRGVAICVAVLIFAKYQFEGGGYGLLLVLMAMGAFTYVAKKTVDDWQNLTSFGTTTFTFHRVPFLLGGKLEGVIRTNLAGMGGETRLMLSCFQGLYDDEDGPIWRAFHVLLPNEMHREGDNVAIEVRFNIPINQRPAKLGWLPFVWELSVVKGFPGVNRVVTFQMPVFGREAEPFVQETTAGQLAKREIRKAISVFDD